MSIAAKPLIAGTLLVGMTAVWVPRLTGYDPFGWLPEESLPTPSEPVPPFPDFPTETGEAASSAASEGATTSGPTGPSTTGLAEVERDALSLSSLKDVVQFLERRGNTRERESRQAQTARTQAERDVDEAGDPAPFIEEALEVVSPPAGAPLAQGHSVRDQLDDFLRDYPLHTIIHGNDLSTATFGNQRVAAGDSLRDDAFEVREITADAVLLQTADGPAWVRLPPPGSSTYAPRPSSDSSRSAAAPALLPDDPDTPN